LAEQSLVALAEKAHVSYSILRFAPVYAHDFRLNIDKRLYLRVPTVGYYLGRGDYQLSLCSIRNIEFFVTQWLNASAPVSGTFNLADSTSYSARELLRFERQHQRAKTVVPLPLLPCLTALGVRETLLSVRDRDPGMYTTGNFRKLARSTLYSAKRAESVFGRLPGNVEMDLYESNHS
jgi:hypothetical protein